MNQRIPLDHLTSDQLDHLYVELDRLTAELADYNQRVEQLEAALKPTEPAACCGKPEGAVCVHDVTTPER